MTGLAEGDRCRLSVTDGEIAAINLESARRRAWARFGQGAQRLGVAEAVVDGERLAAQFLGDLAAFDRLEVLAREFARVDVSYRTALIDAEVATAVHRFDDARRHLARAALKGGPCGEIERLSLTIDQACGVKLDDVLAARRRNSDTSGRFEDRVLLGAVLADLEHLEQADVVYREALDSYDGISPFPLAWTCFQLGVLWGELIPSPDLNQAALWYRRAIDYLPGYVKARVHLAETCAGQGLLDDAEALLRPALSSQDPEVRWRLADVLAAQERRDEAEAQLNAATCGFDDLLGRHPLAFADHGAEFYAGSGNDSQRALALAQLNVGNRPTRRALKQEQAISVIAGKSIAASAVREALNAPTYL